MSNTSDTATMGDQLPLSIDYPEDEKDFRNKLYNVNQRTAQAVNTKVGGLYTPQERGTGAQYSDFTNPQKNLNVYRVTVNFGVLPNSGTKSVPHGIPGWNSSYKLVQCYGGATAPATSLWVPIPNQNILVTGDATNVTITTTTDYSAYNEVTVVIEYIKGS